MGNKSSSAQLPWLPGKCISDPCSSIISIPHKFCLCILLYKTQKLPSPLLTAHQVPLTSEMSFFWATCITALALAISSSSGSMSSSGLDLILESLISLQLRTANVSESSSLPSRSKGRISSTKQAGIHKEEIICFSRSSNDGEIRKIKHLDQELSYRAQFFVCQIFKGRPLPRMLWLILVVMLNLCSSVKWSSRKV